MATAFPRLDQLSLADFLEEESDPEACWLFIHIPKTAGSSLSNELARARPPYRNIHIDYRDQTIPHDDQMQAAVDRFIADARDTRFRSASGHIHMHHARQIQSEVPNTRLVTILRDPVARVVSDYRYQRTPRHPPHREFIARFPGIESYVESAGSQNKMVRHLGGDVDEAIEACAFIGLLEMYPFSFNMLFRLMGAPRMPKLHERKTEPNADNVVDLTDDLEDRIRAVNGADIALHARVKSMLRTRRPEWVALREREKAAADQAVGAGENPAAAPKA